MKILKKTKDIELGPQNNGLEIFIFDTGHFKDYLNIKVTYTKKGFGIQVFHRLDQDELSRRPLNVIVGDKRKQQDLYQSTYVSVWKLLPKYAKSLLQRWKEGNL